MATFSGLMEQAGFKTARELAGACGIKTESMQKIMWGYRSPTGTTLTALCIALKQPAEVIMGAVRNARRSLERRQRKSLDIGEVKA